MFRIYLTGPKKYVNNTESLLNSDGEVYVFGYSSSISKIRDGEYKVELFSGLSDINNVPIYEGDIIKYLSYDDWLDKDGYETYGIVHFDKRYGTFAIWNDINLHDFYRGSELHHFSKNSTVIGNVNQNPELIQKYIKNENKKN